MRRHVAAIAVALSLAGRASGQGNDTFKGYRALAQLADEFQHRYRTVVTYEDPQWTSLGGTQDGPLRSTTAAIPPELIPDRTPVLDARALGNILAAYQKDNNGTAFRVIASPYGLHIAPMQSLLDTIITIPPEVRSIAGHIDAICQSVSAIIGSKLARPSEGAPSSIYGLFAPFGGTFEWGVKQVTARDALIDLLSRGATTTWRLFCGAGDTPLARTCWLGTPLLWRLTPRGIWSASSLPAVCVSTCRTAQG